MKLSLIMTKDSMPRILGVFCLLCISKRPFGLKLHRANKMRRNLTASKQSFPADHAKKQDTKVCAVFRLRLILDVLSDLFWYSCKKQQQLSIIEKRTDLPLGLIVTKTI